MMGIVLTKLQGNDRVLEEKVTFLDADERARARMVVDQIVLHPSKRSQDCLGRNANGNRVASVSRGCG